VAQLQCPTRCSAFNVPKGEAEIQQVFITILSAHASWSWCASLELEVRAGADVLAWSLVR